MQHQNILIDPVIAPMASRVIIWDFRLRIADCGLMESLRSIDYNGQIDPEAHDRQNSLNRTQPVWEVQHA